MNAPDADGDLASAQLSGREAILAAATGNFQRLGYHGTSMRDIARDCQITVASIYHHFPSKQEILQEIMISCLTDVINDTSRAVAGAGDSPRDQLTAAVKAWILFHTTRQAEALVGGTEIRSLDEQGRASVVALRDQQERVIRDVIDRGCASGEFATIYPREATRAIVNMGSTVAAWFDARGELTPEQLADRYAVLALGTVEATS